MENSREPAHISPEIVPEEEILTLAEIEKRYITKVLGRFSGNQRRTARALGISRWTLARKIKKYSIRIK